MIGPNRVILFFCGYSFVTVCTQHVFCLSGLIVCFSVFIHRNLTGTVQDSPKTKTRALSTRCTRIAFQSCCYSDHQKTTL